MILSCLGCTFLCPIAQENKQGLTISVVRLANASSTVAAILPPSSWRWLPLIGVVGQPKIIVNRHGTKDIVRPRGLPLTKGDRYPG